MVDYPGQWARPIFEDPPAFIPVDVPLSAEIGGVGTLTADAPDIRVRVMLSSEIAAVGELALDAPTIHGKTFLNAQFSGVGIFGSTEPETHIHLSADIHADAHLSMAPRDTVMLGADIGASGGFESGGLAIRVYRRLSAVLGGEGALEGIRKTLSRMYAAFPGAGEFDIDLMQEVTPIGPPGGMQDEFDEEWIFEPYEEMLVGAGTENSARVWVGFSSTLPTSDEYHAYENITEPVGATRVMVTNDEATWNEVGDDLYVNGATIVFPAATATFHARYVVVYDAIGPEEEVIYYAELPSLLTVANGSTPTFTPGSLELVPWDDTED